MIIKNFFLGYKYLFCFKINVKRNPKGILESLQIKNIYLSDFLNKILKFDTVKNNLKIKFKNHCSSKYPQKNNLNLYY